MKNLFTACLLAFVACLSAPAAEWLSDASLDRLGDNLRVSLSDHWLRAQLSGSADLTYYRHELPPPGVLQTTKRDLLAPRLILFADLQAGDRWYFFAQARADRGFDPGDRGARLRLDEWALRFTPWLDGRVTVQVGQFATIVGRWVERHLPADHAFVSAPLPYEQVTRLSDVYAPPSEAYLSYMPRGARYDYNPHLWGPAYTSGVAVAGRWGPLEWAVEAKNAPPFSRPERWSWQEVGMEHPTWAGRLTWRPTLAWKMGVSVSEGPFLSESAYVSAPHSHRDYRQRILLIDFSYALHHLEIWGEAMQVRYELPEIPALDSTAYFIEARYRFSPAFAAAIRWNDQRYSRLGSGGGDHWGAPARRLDLAGVWRLSAHLQIKLELNLRRDEEGLDGSGWSSAAQLLLEF